MICTLQLYFFQFMCKIHSQFHPIRSKLRSIQSHPTAYMHYYDHFTHLIVFHTSVSWWFFHWSLSDSKFPQVAMTLLSCLTDPNNAVVWMASARPLISKSSSPCTNAPVRIGITVTFMFHIFFNSLARSWYLSHFSPSVVPYGQLEHQSWQVLFFCWLSLFLVI